MRLLPPDHLARGPSLLSVTCIAALASSTALAITPQRAPPSNLDLSNLGQVAVAGNFDSISLYEFVNQQQSTLAQNGSNFILGRYQSGGAFYNVDMADASIAAMCAFYPQGQLAGVVAAGNFTSLGGQQSTAAALYDATTGQVSPLSGLNGQVRALYCDNATSTVYVGGTFNALNSSNAIAWTTGWTNLPISGFNGPVNAIDKLPNGHLVFGGQFSGLARQMKATPKVPNAQVVNLGSATITSGPPAENAQYRDPRNAICKTSSQAGAGNAWLTADRGGGFWRADFGFGFTPSKLRLYQSTVPGYATREFRFTAFPINGIMNLTYVDPVTGRNASCTNGCPLPLNNQTYQDFYFVNAVGMNSFIIDVTRIEGNGGGFGGIELFQDDIYSYAISDFNEPVCDGVSEYGARSSSQGSWTRTPAGNTNSDYLTAFIPPNTPSNSTNLQVVFYPDIRQAGNYSVNIYTPGCLGDKTCNTRGSISVSGELARSTTTSALAPTVITQTNDYVKYDNLANNIYIDAVSDNFRPSITLVPAASQNSPNGLTIVAQRIGFVLLNSTMTAGEGLNGLFEYDPNSSTSTTMADISTNVVASSGNQLRDDATVNAIKVVGSSTFVGGRFSASAKTLNNIMVISDNATSLPNGGLNDAVSVFHLEQNALFIGGNFTNTFDKTQSGLNNVVAWNTDSNTWSALGAGVNGKVTNIVPLQVNITGQAGASAVALSGSFSQINAFGNNAAVPVDNIAVWVPSQNNWLDNLSGANLALSGHLTAYAQIAGQDTIYAGNVDSAQLSASGSAALQPGSGGNSKLAQIPFKIAPLEPSSGASASAMTKRDAPQGAVSGVFTGLYYVKNGNVQAQAFGGRFQAQVTNGSTASNLVVVYPGDNNRTSGLSYTMDNSDVVTALENRDNILYVGGSINRGILLYDMDARDVTRVQPPSLNGPAHAIGARPNNADVYVGGAFTMAGSFPCYGICLWDSSSMQWRNVNGGTFTPGSVVNTLQWVSDDRLILAGNFTIDNQYATLASYDAKAEKFNLFVGSGDSNLVPGPITTLSSADNSFTSFFLGGISRKTNSAFVIKYTPNDGSKDEAGGKWTSVLSDPNQLGQGALVQGLQVVPLSQAHSHTDMIGDKQALLVTGPLNLAGFGNVSAALYNGTSFVPFALSTTTGGSAGSLRRIFVQNPTNLYNNNNNQLAVGYIVLIGLAIALGLILLLILIGFIAERLRRRREGYVPAPGYTYGMEKSPAKSQLGVGGISPERLFGGVQATPSRL